MLTRKQLKKQSNDLRIDIHFSHLNEIAMQELFSIAEKHCSKEIKPLALHIISSITRINQRKAHEMIAELHDLHI